MGLLADPQILSVTNDGSRVAFNARDQKHEGDLWYGDLADQSVKIVYAAKENGSNQVDIWWPQLAAGHLLWIEYLHAGSTVSTPVKSWAVKDLDVTAGRVRTVVSGSAPGYGGTKVVDRIRFDGSRIAMMETLSQGWRIEVAGLAGHVDSTIALSRTPFDVALVSDGVLYSTGVVDKKFGTFGQMRLWHWTAFGGSSEIGKDVFQINASGDMASWVADPAASQQSTGYFQSARIYASASPFSTSEPISPVDSETATQGVDGAATGSGTIAWWEAETFMDVWIDVLTFWQPGWQTPIQVNTEGSDSYLVSANGGWLVWAEETGRGDPSLQERIRGIPISTLLAQPHIPA